MIVGTPSWEQVGGQSRQDVRESRHSRVARLDVL
jgi:hypothetical protein